MSRPAARTCFGKQSSPLLVSKALSQAKSLEPCLQARTSNLPAAISGLRSSVLPHAAMPFPQCFGDNKHLEIPSDEELPPDARNKDVEAEVVSDTDEEPIEISSESDTKSEENIPDDSEYRLRGGLQHLWGAHRGHGDCSGSNQLKCYFGSDDKPAKAGPDGRCDLCSGDSLAALNSDPLGQARITYLLKHLSGKKLQHAYVRIKLVLGEETMRAFEWRRTRALHRSLQRPKGKARKRAHSEVTREGAVATKHELEIE